MAGRPKLALQDTLAGLKAVNVQKVALGGINAKIDAVALRKKIHEELAAEVDPRTISREVLEAVREFSLAQPGSGPRFELGKLGYGDVWKDLMVPDSARHRYNLAVSSLSKNETAAAAGDAPASRMSKTLRTSSSQLSRVQSVQQMDRRQPVLRVYDQELIRPEVDGVLGAALVKMGASSYNARRVLARLDAGRARAGSQ